MSDRLEGHHRSDADHPSFRQASDRTEWERLEEVGDLHFQASSFSSALDYYRRLFDDERLRLLPAAQILEILRKSVDAALNLGDLSLADSLLQQASALLNRIPDLAAEERARLGAPLMGRRATLYVHHGDYKRALNVAKHAFTILAVTDAHKEVANLQVTMGACHQRLGRLEKAKEFYTDALSTFRRIGDELGTASLYNNLALLAKNGCRWQQSLDLMEKAVSLAKKHGASHLLSRLYLNEGIILSKLSRLGEARTVLEKSLRLSRSLGDRARQAKACLAYGRLEIQCGRLSRAEELVLEGKLLSEQEDFSRESTIADEYLGDILLERNEFEKALFNYDLGLERSRRQGLAHDLEGELLRRTAEAQRRLERLDEAIENGLAAISICEKCGEVYELGFCHRTLGFSYAAKNEWQLVDSHFRQAIAIFQKQNLVPEWSGAILDYLDARLATASQAELLLLRRFLLEVQEDSGTSLSEVMTCRSLQGLAEVQLRLGQFDDALLTVYELERNGGGLKESEFLDVVSELRSRIEQRLLGEIEHTGHHLQAISGIPGLFSRSDGSIPRNLSSVLHAGMEKVQADTGFIAMQSPEAGEERLTVVAREGLTENLAAQLARWYAQEKVSADPASPRLFSRLNGRDALLDAVPALQGHTSGCVFMPIALHGSRFGLLYLGQTEQRERKPGFGRQELDFLAVYMGFLALFLYEKTKAQPSGEQEHIPSPIEGVASFENIITRNEAMLDVLRLIQKVAPSDLTTLLIGETGTGKGLLAYAIHALSRRKNHKFLSINCAAIPETLLESELFGHVKGSFTGAHADKQGLLIGAEGGTVFLDEVGKMPLSMQGKLLHFMDTKIVRPVGSVRELRADVRVVCATKTDLQELAQKGQFLEDLYYRLLDFPLEIPPLRLRRDDIQLLAQHFIDRFSQELDIDPPQCSTPFMDALVQHDWPGNVRELEKCLRRAIVLAQDDHILRSEHLPAALVGLPLPASAQDRIPPLRETLSAVECREITMALKLAAGNKSKAARLLKISYPNLLKKIRFYGIQNGS